MRPFGKTLVGAQAAEDLRELFIMQSITIFERLFQPSNELRGSIDKIGKGLFTPISSHVINLLIEHLLISPPSFMPCKVVP